MSLADLPDVLIAHLTSYLEYEDVCNLMETSKKNYNAIKAYKKDKLQFDTLKLFNADYTTYQRLEAVTNSKDEQQSVKFSFKHFDVNEEIAVIVTNVLKECSSVRRLEFDGHHLTSDLVETLLKAKTKIGHVCLKSGNMEISVGKIIELSQKFKGSEFNLAWFRPETWCDDILIQLIGNYTEIKKAIEVYPFVHEERPATLVTNQTLKALFGPKFRPNSFKISEIYNSFTIEEIVFCMKNLKDIDINGKEYHFGNLQADQLNEAERYFNRRTGELKNSYLIISRNFGFVQNYKIYVRCSTYRINVKEDTALVEFNVIKR